jgi:hypothetical protein
VTIPDALKNFNRFQQIRALKDLQTTKAMLRRSMHNDERGGVVKPHTLREQMEIQDYLWTKRETTSRRRLQ